MLTDPLSALVVGGERRGDGAEAVAERGVAVVELAGSRVVLPARWLRDRSLDPRDVEPTTRQRLYDPCDVGELRVTSAVAVGGDEAAGRLVVGFSDGAVRSYRLGDLAVWAGRVDDPDAPPPRCAWDGGRGRMPTASWEAIRSEESALRDLLVDLHRVGCCLITGAPVVPGSLRDVASHFGRVSATNFGELFDVRSVVDPADLAYTPIGLAAHTDQPYRRPVPGYQFLHALANDASGGESTVVDGLAAVERLRRDDPGADEVLAAVVVEWRYDTGADVVVDHAPIICRDADGGLVHLRFSPRLDFPPLLAPDVLDRWYDARRRLADELADPQHRLEFKMAVGDVLVVDNHRVLHGRRPYDPVAGHRHLQGCYVDHDGPASLLRLLARRRRDADGATDARR